MDIGNLAIYQLVVSRDGLAPHPEVVAITPVWLYQMETDIKVQV